MGWYIAAQKIDFSKRNVLNDKIAYLKNLQEILHNMGYIVFQSAKTAKNNTTEILNGKKISSYPVLEEILLEAGNVAYDSPWRFQGFCNEAVYNINNMILTLSQERDDITSKKDNEIKKGWF